MRTVTVSPRAKTLNDLLKRAKRSSLILQAADGQRFVLTSLEEWTAFDVGNGGDFDHEVKATAENKKLMKHLASRRSGSKRIPLAAAKEQLGIK